ncbi:carboxymuconolactone decarboxylase family protein [Actibacterium sp. D379-3]
MTTLPGLHLPPVPDAAWPEEIAEMRHGFAGALNVYRVMAHHPALLRAWAALRDHVVVTNVLGPQRSEVVILRTGVRLGSAYEWGHHVSRGRACGMDDARIAALRGPVAGMAPEDALIAGAVDELFDHKQLTPATAATLADLVGSEGVLDVIATVGFYSTLGYILNSFDTPLDDRIAQDLSEHPLNG